MVKFGLNGSDATTAAVRLARGYTGRELVAICRQHPFFSIHDWFIVTTPMPAGIPSAERRDHPALRLQRPVQPGRAVRPLPREIAAWSSRRKPSSRPRRASSTACASCATGTGPAHPGRDHHRVPVARARGPVRLRHRAGPVRVRQGVGNGFPRRRWSGGPEIMRLGGYADDRDRVFLLSHTAGAEPCARRHDGGPRRLRARGHRRAPPPDRPANSPRRRDGGSGARARPDFQLRGRDSNLVYPTRDERASRARRSGPWSCRNSWSAGDDAPSFVVNAAHDAAAIQHTVDVVAETMPVYRASAQ